jgi:hypothetical protein
MATSKIKIFMELDIISITNGTNAWNLCYIDIYKYSKSINDWSIQNFHIQCFYKGCWKWKHTQRHWGLVESKPHTSHVFILMVLLFYDDGLIVSIIHTLLLPYLCRYYPSVLYKFYFLVSRQLCKVATFICTLKFGRGPFWTYFISPF